MRRSSLISAGSPLALRVLLTRSLRVFVSHRLSSILYKSKLPFLLVFNKTDITSHEFATKWMQDFDAFSAALKNDESYMSSLTRSMSLVLDEFYATIRTVGVSAMTGEGMDSLFAAVQDLTKEYDEVYKPALEQQKKDVERKAEQRKQKQLERMQRDMAADENLQRGEKVVLDGAASASGGSKSAAAAAAAAARRAASAKLHSLGGDGIIQTRSAEQKFSVRHPDEEAEDDFDDEDDAFPDEDDNEAFAYEEDNRGAFDDGEGEEEDEYVNEEAARKDREDFEEFMARIKAQAPAPKPAAAAAAGKSSSSSSSSSAAKKPSAAASRIEENDEGAEEIDTSAKKK